MGQRLMICAAALALAIPATAAASDRAPRPAKAKTPVIVWSGRHGFAWGDAALGAAAAVGFALIVQGLVSPSIRRRKR